MSIEGRTSDEEKVSLQLDRVWHNVFEKYDLDKDDKISIEEFKIFIKEKNHELCNDIPEEVLNEIAERVDWNKDRYITYNEFIRMIHSRDVSHNHPKVNFVMKNVAKFTVPKHERQMVLRKYFDEYKYFRFPFFVIIISLIEISVFTYRWVMYGPFASVQITDNILIYDPHKRKEIWRFLTYMFVHRDIFHIVYNVVGQLLVGLPLELVHGSSRVCLIFLISTIGGSLYSAIIDPQVYIAGASGGVYSLFSAHAANLIINFNEIDFAIYQLAFLIIIYALDLGQAIYHRVNRTIADRPIAYVVHIVGFFCGLLIGLIVLRNLRGDYIDNKRFVFSISLQILCKFINTKVIFSFEKVHKWEQIVSYVALALFVFSIVTAIVYNIMMAPPFGLEDRKGWRT